MPDTSTETDRCFACGTPLAEVQAVQAAELALAGAAGTLSVLARREEFEARHPEVQITTPFENPSRQWQAYVPGEGTVVYDDGQRMMDALEERSPRTAPIPRGLALAGAAGAVSAGDRASR